MRQEGKKRQDKENKEELRRKKEGLREKKIYKNDTRKGREVGYIWRKRNVSGRERKERICDGKRRR